MFGLVENICIGARYSHFISFIAFFLRFGAVEVSPNLGSGPGTHFFLMHVEN